MEHKQKLQPEEKVSIVRRCLRGEISITQASIEGHVAPITIDRWISRYESEGAEAFLSDRTNNAYSTEVKQKAVLAYLNGEGSLRDICKRYKIRHDRQLSNWIKVYNTHGDFNFRKSSGGGSYMRKARNTTQAERIQIAKECITSGKNYGEIALKYKVSYQQVRIWTLRFEELGESGLEDRRGRRKKDQIPRTDLEQARIEIEQLKHKLYLAEMERDLLKKLDEIERRDAFRK